MSVKRLSNIKLQYDDANGVLASSYRLFFYAAGSSTKQNTYNSSTGNIANSNPIVLNALGEPAVEIWLTSGQSYKVGLAVAGTDDPPAAFIWTEDNISGVNDSTLTVDEWVVSSLTPTFVSATSFTLAGDQTSAFHIGRRLKSTNTGGTVYSTITNSVFGALTTVTLANDSGTLDSGLSAVSYSLQAALNPSAPRATLTPAAISASQNNYAPTGYASASVMRISTTARWNITGLAGGADGRVLQVHNVGTFPAVFTFEDASSSVANRFAFGCTLGGGQCMTIQYDATSFRWRPVGLPAGPVGEIRDFGGGTLPGGFLACDFSPQSRTIYAALFNEIGTTWGVGDGTTTFNVPDFRGRGSIGSGTGTISEAVSNGSVDTSGDTFTVASNNTKWITGQPVVLTTSGGLPAGLSLVTTYYLIRSSATLIKFASSLANAQNGTAIDLTTQGTGTHTLTGTLTARALAEIGGEEGHAISLTELLAHAHTYTLITSVDSRRDAGGADYEAATTGSTSSVGGNAAMNVMNPFGVVTKMIRF